MPRTARRIVTTVSSLAIIAILSAAGQGDGPTSCTMCADQCAEDLQDHCLGNANCPWPAEVVTCGANYNCPAGKVEVKCDELLD